MRELSGCYAERLSCVWLDTKQQVERIEYMNLGFLPRVNRWLEFEKKLINEYLQGAIYEHIYV